jgi:hypothetical protein
LALGAAAALALSAGCAPPTPPSAASDPRQGASQPVPGATATLTSPAATAAASSGAAKRLPLAPAPAVKTHLQLRLQAAHRLVDANPERSYSGPTPDPLLAIPVLEVELNADGSVRRIDVLRQPRQARDTTQLAIDAVRRAAPYGDVSRLPKPWKFSETFLFDDERRFKPRTLDQ